MKIALDISPLSSGHKVRGTGFYLQHLQKALERYCTENVYTYFTRSQKLPKSSEMVHYPYFDPFFITLPFFKKKPIVVTVHDLTPFVLPSLFPIGVKGKIKWFIQKMLLQKADAIVTDSKRSKEDIAKIVEYPKDKISVAYLAAGEEFHLIENKKKLEELKQKYNLPETFALYVGDVTANKNLPRLVKAALRANVTLVLVGKALVADTYDKNNVWNRDLREVQQLIHDNPIKLIPLGFVSQEELVALYNVATVFVMPSLYEGFGLPILEAMACGCPVITSREGSLPEVAGEAAIYADAFSVEDIAKHMQHVIGDRNLQKKLHSKGLQQVKLFSWEKTAKQTVEVYRKVVYL